MAYHAHDNEEHILVCPNCDSSYIHPVSKTDTLYNGHYKGIEGDLYGDLGADTSCEYGQDYKNKYNHKALRRQNHFFCEPCLYRYHEWESDYDYLPIYPYKDLHRVHIDDIEEPFIENPYKHFFD